METATADIEASETKPSPVPQTVGWRLAYGIAVTLLPAISFSLIGFLGPLWQTGRLSDYVSLLLRPSASWVFFPLLIYSSFCFLCLLASQQYAEAFWVRLGIYTGTLLAFQFSILTILALFDTIWILLGLWLVPFILVGLYRRLARAIGTKHANRLVYALVGLILIVFACVIVLSNFRSGRSILNEMGGANSMFLFLYVLLGIFPASAPLWSLLIMAGTCYRLLKHYETKFSFAHGIGSFIWLGGFVTAWRFAVLNMLELYAALPPEPPDCYIATAAANGHRQFVCSREVKLEGGKSMRVNEQLRRLKCTELVLLAIAPSVHARVRKLYDVIGKRLAQRMHSPYLADAAYVLLKPAEWITILMLNVLFPETKAFVGKFYRNS